MYLKMKILSLLQQAYQIDGNEHIANEYLFYAIHEFLLFEHFVVDHFFLKKINNSNNSDIQFLPINILKK